MKQIKLFQAAIHALHKLITSEEFMNRSRKKKTDFTRNRKLDFPSVISLIMSIMTKPIHAELCSSYPKLKAGIAQPTQQSFSEARQKIHYQAFEEIFQQGVSLGLSASDGKTFRGYRLLAIDGSTIPLKKSDELREYVAQTTPVPNEIYGRVSCVYDVLNHMLLDAQLAPFHDGERLLASTSIEKVENYFHGQRIYLLDRGYWQMELYSKILSMGHSLVARVRNHMTKELKYGSPTATISFDSQQFTLRVVRLLLPSGETETLVTNLSPHEFSDQDIAQLYSLRWGVETAYDGLKNLLAMNNISSKTRLTVYQDFYALLAVFNLAAFASYAANAKIINLRAGKHNKYAYKANRFTILAALKPALPLLLYAHSEYLRRKYLHSIFAAFSARPVPIRDNRPSDRSRTILKYKNHPPKKPI